MVGNEDQITSLLSDMKGEEFNDYVLEQATSVEGIEVNDKAINSVKLSKLVTDSNRNGTSSGTESSSSTDESSSAEESSTTESETSSEA